MEKTALGGIGLLVLRVLVSPITCGVLTVAFIGLFYLVVKNWGIVPVYVVLGAGAFWLLGWGAARRYWRKHGYVPRI